MMNVSRILPWQWETYFTELQELNYNQESASFVDFFDKSFLGFKTVEWLEKNGIAACGVHPWKLTWNPKMEVWKMIFLINWVFLRFHVSFPGCIDICMHFSSFFYPLFLLWASEKLSARLVTCKSLVRTRNFKLLRITRFGEKLNFIFSRLRNGFSATKGQVDKKHFCEHKSYKSQEPCQLAQWDWPNVPLKRKWLLVQES